MRTSRVVPIAALFLLIPMLLTACVPIRGYIPVQVTPASPMAGATMTNPTDGAVYVYVPGGPFTMGSADEDSMAASDEVPQSSVTTDGYWIMRTEATNAQYMRCVDAKACADLHTSQPHDPQYADYPVTMVSWQQANEYAKWAGGRLPTEAEWEKACRGTDARSFPWGDQATTAALANAMPALDVLPAGSLPEGASPYGALDMAGNVWEMTSSQYMPYPYQADDGRESPDGDAWVIRGGSFMDRGDFGIRCARRWHRPEKLLQRADLGFRVVLPEP